MLGVKKPQNPKKHPPPPHQTNKQNIKIKQKKQIQGGKKTEAVKRKAKSTIIEFSGSR